MKKVISIFLVIIGIVLLAIPNINKMIIKHNIDTKVKELDTITYEDIEKNTEIEAEFDYSSIEDVSVTSTIFESINFDDKSIIGQITIPDLNLNLPILKGVNNPNLSIGAVTMVPDQKMGEGNYSLAGHKMKDKTLLFGSLMDIQLGSIVYITDKKTVYEYKIYDTVVVADTAFYMLENDKAEERGKPIISLMTCYHSSNTGKRFFALGVLIDEYPFEEKMIK